MNWSYLAFLGGALPIPFLLMMLVIPETPRWYVSRGRDEEARKALQWLRGKKADVEPELKGIIKTHTDAERHQSSNGIMQLLRRSNLKPLSISLGLMFFQQFSGINAVIFYAEKIFILTKSKLETSLCVIIIGIVNFIATFVATFFIDRLGRKVNDSCFMRSFEDFANHKFKFLGVAIHFGNRYDYNIGGTWRLFLCKGRCTERCVEHWLVAIGQSHDFCHLLLTRIRTHTMADDGRNFASENSWLGCISGNRFQLDVHIHRDQVIRFFNGYVLQIYAKTKQIFTFFCVFLTAAFGIYVLFWIFGTICLIGLFFVIFKVPETQGKSLEDIERKMMGRIRRMSSVANIRPLSFNM